MMIDGECSEVFLSVFIYISYQRLELNKVQRKTV